MYQWVVATAWALPANAAAASYSLASASYNHSNAFCISYDKASLFTMKGGSIYQYTMSTVGKISTATTLKVSTAIAAKENTPFSLSYYETEIYYVTTANKLNRYKLYKGDDLTTAISLKYGTSSMADATGIRLTPNGILYKFVASPTISKILADTCPLVVTFPNNKTYCITSIS